VAVVLHSGRLSLSIITGQTRGDLDTASVSSEAKPGASPEFVLRKQFINAKDGSEYSIWSGSGMPTMQQCVAATGWINRLTDSQVTVGLVLCVRTSERRPAAAMFTAVGTKNNGKLESVTIAYTVWKKASDP
jgi:hypothetical protein